MKLRDLDIERLISLRKRLMTLIDKELEKDFHHKSYEGAIELYLNNRFEYDTEDPEVVFYIRCYVHSEINDTFYTLDEIEFILDKWEKELNENS